MATAIEGKTSLVSYLSLCASVKVSYLAIKDLLSGIS